MATNMDNIGRIGGTAVLRNPQRLPLEEAQIKKFSQAIFAKKPITGVSDNYGHVATIEVIRALRDNGFECVEVRQSQRRDVDRMPYTKHMLRFAQQGSKGKLKKVGDTIPEVVMLNSHDRSSGFHLYYGLFRLACSNGLIVSAGELVEPIKIRHTSSMVQDIIKRSVDLVKGADGVYALREAGMAIELTPKQQLAYATAALEFRPPRRRGLMDPASLLQVRRPEDESNSLWMVYNRIQENLLRGGADTVTENGRGVKTKGIGRIERDVEVNTKLWGQFVEGIAKQTKKPLPKQTKARATAEALGI